MTDNDNNPETPQPQPFKLRRTAATIPPTIFWAWPAEILGDDQVRGLPATDCHDDVLLYFGSLLTEMLATRDGWWQSGTLPPDNATGATHLVVLNFVEDPGGYLAFLAAGENIPGDEDEARALFYEVAKHD